MNLVEFLRDWYREKEYEGSSPSDTRQKHGKFPVTDDSPTQEGIDDQIGGGRDWSLQFQRLRQNMETVFWKCHKNFLAVGSGGG
jgi:hypothetical protein